MIRFFTNRELSKKLGINLAKWKRWSREFLPPDPLGGLQSGYARQYNPVQAFTVYLGGHLVSDLKYTVPECRQILEDLNDWLQRFGFLFEPVKPGSSRDMHAMVEAYQVFIQSIPGSPQSPIRFSYLIRGILSVGPTDFKGYTVKEELFYETTLPDEIPPFSHPHKWDLVRIVNITAIHNRFLTALNLKNHG